jgi:hypothetical protein
MVILSYSKPKLLFAAAATLAIAGLYVWALLTMDPPQRIRGTISFLLATPRLAPIIAGVLMVLVWRACSLALGNSGALEGTSTELVATTWWKTSRTPWRFITQVSGEVTYSRYGRSERLIVRTVDDEIVVPLAYTDHQNGCLQGLIDSVEALHAAALSLASGAAPARSAASSFAHAAAAAPAPRPAQPARPAFGRKAV